MNNTSNSSDNPILNIEQLLNSMFAANAYEPDNISSLNTTNSIFGGIAMTDWVGGGAAGILERSMQDMGGVKKRTSKEVINNLSVVEVFNNNIHCAICQETIGNGAKAIKLPCSGTPHYFCLGDEPEKCEGVKPWLKEHNTCPICRFELPVEIEEKKELPVESEPVQPRVPPILRNYVQQLIQQEMSYIDGEGFDTREFEQAIHQSLDENPPDLEDNED